VVEKTRVKRGKKNVKPRDCETKKEKNLGGKKTVVRKTGERGKVKGPHKKTKPKRTELKRGGGSGRL